MIWSLVKPCIYSMIKISIFFSPERVASAQKTKRTAASTQPHIWGQTQEKNLTRRNENSFQLKSEPSQYSIISLKHKAAVKLTKIDFNHIINTSIFRITNQLTMTSALFGRSLSSALRALTLSPGQAVFCSTSSSCSTSSVSRVKLQNRIKSNDTECANQVNTQWRSKFQTPERVQMARDY